MQPVGIYYHHKFLEHDWQGHPENAERLTAVMKVLYKEAAHIMQQMPFSAASFEQLCAVHHALYIRELEYTSASGGGLLDGGDTYTNDASFDAAAMGAGACIAATQAVLGNDLSRAFVLPRPPGHHAYADHAEGFCLFNNVAFAAKTALEAGLERVVILDWDVHHGNGTESIFYDDHRVLYISTHQYGMYFYPGTGSMNTIGRGGGAGFNLNIPMPLGAGDAGYARVFEEVIEPKIRQFRPQLILLSAGYDAHWRDPLANMTVSIGGFGHMSHVMCRLSDEFCDGKLVTVLEGGYDLEALGYGVLSTLHMMSDGAIADVKDPIGTTLHEHSAHLLDGLISQLQALHGIKSSV